MISISDFRLKLIIPAFWNSLLLFHCWLQCQIEITGRINIINLWSLYVSLLLNSSYIFGNILKNLESNTRPWCHICRFKDILVFLIALSSERFAHTLWLCATRSEDPPRQYKKQHVLLLQNAMQYYWKISHFNWR